MKATRLLTALKKAGKRAHVVGNLDAGAIVALDVEGRWFATLGGEVLNLVRLEAIVGQSTRNEYLNPGGDGLWPAPEGTTLGYEYSTGDWRVPPGLTGACYLLTQAAARSATIRAEIDLINNAGVGVPTVFQRRIAIFPGKKSLTVRVKESIIYIGSRPLRRAECKLAPWTLCQFDSGPGCEVVFPSTRKTSVWDLYEQPSNDQRRWDRRLCHTRTDGSGSYQIGIAKNVPLIEFRNPHRGLVVRRKADPLPTGRSHIDIRDAAPDVSPRRKGVRYSVYSDTDRFMEIEAVGGCPAIMRPNSEMSLTVSTQFALT